LQTLHVRPRRRWRAPRGRMNIRDFLPDDAPAVRGLFIRINRLLAPAEMKDAFEGYIKRSLT
jgi:hypothetical protein